MLTKQTLLNIKKICLQYQIDNFWINPNGSIDVDGDVDLFSTNLAILPIKFGRVMGDFNVQNNLLSTLYGAPVAVGGNFNCYHNRLTNLIGSPKWVGADFFCYKNQLVSLEGSPKVVRGSYYISGNDKLSNLAGCTLQIGANFSFDDILSTYSGDEDILFEGNFFLNETNFGASNAKKLPNEIVENIRHIKLILKYQRYFMIWNDDLSLNRENFNDLILEIEDGLA
jgi:hypothetical protein